eukprot:8151053-Pyramimonas_sp.AAC.1
MGVVAKRELVVPKWADHRRISRMFDFVRGEDLKALGCVRRDQNIEVLPDDIVHKVFLTLGVSRSVTERFLTSMTVDDCLPVGP